MPGLDKLAPRIGRISQLFSERGGPVVAEQIKHWMKCGYKWAEGPAE
jgi:hypothetical protein